MPKRAVITGRGVVSPLGVGIAAHRANLFSGRSSIRSSARLRDTAYSLSSAAEIEATALKDWVALLPPKQRKLMNRAGIMAAVASLMAIQEAKLEMSKLDSERVGVFLATWLTSYDMPTFLRFLGETEALDRSGMMNFKKANTLWLEKMNPIDTSLKVLPNLSAGHLAILYGARGSSRMVADAWRGGLLAIGHAARAVMDGDLDVALAGGAESPLEEGVYNEICDLDVMASDGKDGAPLCKPFDAARQGMVLGEGAGLVVLEERKRAIQRGARILGEVKGLGNSAPGSDGDSAAAIARAFDRALAASRIRPQEIGFIHANGDGTKAHDSAEWEGIRRVLGSSALTIPVTATKSLHGHLLSAAGGVEVISALLMLEESRVAPIANCDHPDPSCALNLVRGEASVAPRTKACTLNAVGLFGEAATLVIGDGV
jgi:3-oxoacyl-[acyl-carrier-protein] synthase II